MSEPSNNNSQNNNNPENSDPNQEPTEENQVNNVENSQSENINEHSQPNDPNAVSNSEPNPEQEEPVASSERNEENTNSFHENPSIGNGEHLESEQEPNAEQQNQENQEQDQERLENESLYSYDENRDFPVFANKINKKLNDIILNYKKELRVLIKNTDEDREMVKILKEHLASVEKQVKNREKMLEEMTQNVVNQSHTIEVVKRQIGKVKSQRKNLENQELSLQERFNILQQNIAKANEKMDSYKLNMKNILEELEQWALAARQKEDDKLNIEKYYRHDELKIKETMLQIEKLTQDVNARMHDLEREVTETQAAQIEMEKTTEELRQLQAERQGLLDELIRTQENIKNLSDDLRNECDRYYKNKVELGKSKEDLDKKMKLYEDGVKMNKKAEEEIKQNEAHLSNKREEYQNNEVRYMELQNDIENKKNELSVLAKNLNVLTYKTNVLKTELEKKKKSLDEAKSEYNNKKDEIERNTKKYMDAKEAEEKILKDNVDLNKQLKQSKEDLDKIASALYEETQILYDLRAKEANMIGDINNVISAKKNLRANILKLDNEITKQGELLYNVDFQIQLMERKVDWVQGKRTQEETNEINKKTEILEKVTSDLTKKLNKIENSLIMINEDLRTVDTKLKTATEEKDKLTSIIEELELENMKCGQDLQKIVKNKEEVLVEHDLMKLEIKKIYDRLLDEANVVFNKENKLSQLEISIKEREKEINVHKDILIAEHKSAEEERHKVAVELSMKLTRAKNLKLKYESLIQKNKKGDEGEEKYSQAYYIIKTAQEKEELQRQKDEMEGKITKCRKDLKSLKKTLSSLKERNEKLKKALILKEKGEIDVAKVNQLEEKVERENKEMWEKKKELENLNNSIQSGQQKIEEKTIQINVLKQNIDNYQGFLGKQLEDSKKKKESSERAQKRFDKIVKEKKINLESSDIGAEIALNNEKLKNKFLKNSIVILSSELDDVKNVFSNELQDFQIPSRPLSEKMSSVASSHNSSKILEP